MTWLIHTSSQPSSDEAGKNGIARRRTFDPQMLEWTETRIERLYADFDLQLKVVIFSGNGPEMPWETLNRFK